ncbi:hypothetical protein HDU93_003386 [Gonapodya sp. JEL0774]|nr:hypothetical protein HDU93_003386 [Gonapodya sp. JEL0774]
MAAFDTLKSSAPAPVVGLVLPSLPLLPTNEPNVDNDDNDDDFVDAEEGEEGNTPEVDVWANADAKEGWETPGDGSIDDNLNTWPQDASEAAALIQRLEASLEKDLTDVQLAVDLFLDSRFQEAEDFLQPKFGTNLYYTLGDPTDVSQALDSIKTIIALSNRLRRRSSSITSVLSSVHNFVRPGQGLSFMEMSPLQKHAELVHAEAYLMKAILSLVTDTNLVAFVREGISIRSSYGVYRSAWLHVGNTSSEKLDDHFVSGVLLGIGSFNLVLSFLPSKILRLFEVIGFTGDQELGLKCIEIGAGFDLPQRTLYGSYKKQKGVARTVTVGRPSVTPERNADESDNGSPISPAQSPAIGTASLDKPKGRLSVFKGALSTVVKSTVGRVSSPSGISPSNLVAGIESDGFPVSTPKKGIRSFLCGLSLAGFHAILPNAVPMANGDPDLATLILDRCLADYPNSTYHRLLQARHLTMHSGEPDVAAQCYLALLSTPIQWRTLHHIAYWDLAHLHAVRHEWAKAQDLYGILFKESRWSPTIYLYARGVCMGMEGKWSEAVELLSGIEGKMQRIAGKRIPLEKFVARKVRKMQQQGGRLTLPALEFYYMFGYFCISATADLLKSLSIINAELLVMRNEAPAELWRRIEELGADARILVDDSDEGDGGEASNTFFESKPGKSTALRENWWDDLALLYFLRGVTLRELSLPTRLLTKPVAPATISSSPIPSTEFPPPKPTPQTPSSTAIPASSTIPDAMADFATVAGIAHLIRLDHYLLPFAQYELGNLFSGLGYYNRARGQFELAKCGGFKEKDAKKRGWKVGKYGDGAKHSNDSWLSLRLHNALEKLNVAERRLSADPLPPLSVRLREVVSAYIPVSLLSFGGGQAGIAMYFEFFVEKKAWLTEQEFLEIYSVIQLIPGPGNAQTSYAIAMALRVARFLAGFKVSTMQCVVLLLVSFYLRDSNVVSKKGTPDKLTTAIATIGFVFIVVAPRAPYVYAIQIVAGGLVTYCWDLVQNWWKGFRSTPAGLRLRFIARRVRRKQTAKSISRDERSATKVVSLHVSEESEMEEGERLTNAARGHNQDVGLVGKEVDNGNATGINGMSGVSDNGVENTEGGGMRMRTVPQRTSIDDSEDLRADTVDTGTIHLPPTSAEPDAVSTSRMRLLLKELITDRSLILDIVVISLLTGSLAYGGAGAIITIMQPLATAHWMTNAQFLIGYALVNVIPGPNLTLAGYVGTVAFRSTSSSPGLAVLFGLLAWFLAFVPGLSLATGVFSFWKSLRELSWIRSMMRGVKSSGVAQVFGGAYYLGATCILGRSNGASLADYPFYISITVVAFILTHKYNVSAPFAILLGG